MKERVAIRFVSDHDAIARSSGKSVATAIIDISTDGCGLIIGEDLLEPGAKVRLKIVNVTSLDGIVVWSSRGRVGMAFDKPLHAAMVMYLSYKIEADITIEDLRNDQLDGVITA